MSKDKEISKVIVTCYITARLFNFEAGVKLPSFSSLHDYASNTVQNLVHTNNQRKVIQAVSFYGMSLLMIIKYFKYFTFFLECFMLNI